MIELKDDFKQISLLNVTQIVDYIDELKQFQKIEDISSVLDLKLYLDGDQVVIYNTGSKLCGIDLSFYRSSKISQETKKFVNNEITKDEYHDIFESFINKKYLKKIKDINSDFIRDGKIGKMISMNLIRVDQAPNFINS